MADDFDYSMFDNYGTDDEPFYDFEFDDLLRTSGPSSGGPADAGFDYSMFDNYGTDDDPLYGYDLEDLLKTSGPSSGGPADAGFDYSMFDGKKDKNFLEKMFGGVGSALGLGGGKSGGIGGSGISPLQGLLALGGASYLKDRGSFDPKVPVVGYQGKIPEYQYVQEQVTGRDDSDRRPGSGGRRYMSDGIYAKAPENREPMSVAEAKAKAKAQAQGFAEGGDVAAFLQGIGGEGGGQSFQQLMQGMQPQGRAAPQRMQTAPARPAPMPMPAPSGGMGGMDMLALAALLQGQQGQQGGEAQPQAQPQQALPPGVAPGGKYYDFNGTPMYQPPMPTAAPGQLITQQLPTPIDLTTGEPQRTSEADLKKALESLNNAKSAPVTEGGGLSERLKEAMKGKMPTPATDTIGTSGYKLGKGDRPQKSSSPPLPPFDKTDMLEQLKGRGTLPDRPAPMPTPDMLKKMGEVSPVQLKPAPRRAPAPPMDYSKILSGIGGVGMAEGGYLNGDSDGQADEVPGSIDGVQEARLSHGEYVLPADLVALLGNGNSDAGAKALDDFMAMVRRQGTGTEKQQKNIKADKVLASLMQGKG